MRKFLFAFIILCLAAPTLVSCLKEDETTDYTEWKAENDAYVLEQENLLDADGSLYYTKVIPNWDPGIYVLMHWHNDRSLTAKELQPLYNSTCNTIYYLTTIEEAVDSSYNATTYGDSIYQCTPSGVISGYAAALMNMHVGDSVTLVIPYDAGYGSTTTSNLKPYSTLIYGLKLTEIPAYEKPM